MIKSLTHYAFKGTPIEKVKAELATLLLEGTILSQRELAKNLMVSRTTAIKWLELYREGGVDKLLTVNPAGRPSLGFQRKRFIAKLLLGNAGEPAPSSLGTIARRARVSVPTVSRIRKRLLERGIDLGESRTKTQIKKDLRRVRQEGWLVTLG